MAHIIHGNLRVHGPVEGVFYDTAGPHLIRVSNVGALHGGVGARGAEEDVAFKTIGLLSPVAHLRGECMLEI